MKQDKKTITATLWECFKPQFRDFLMKTKQQKRGADEKLAQDLITQALQRVTFSKVRQQLSSMLRLNNKAVVNMFMLHFCSQS